MSLPTRSKNVFLSFKHNCIFYRKIHNHSNSNCVIKVLEGQVVENHFVVDNKSSDEKNQSNLTSSHQVKLNLDEVSHMQGLFFKFWFNSLYKVLIDFIMLKMNKIWEQLLFKYIGNLMCSICCMMTTRVIWSLRWRHLSFQENLKV